MITGLTAADVHGSDLAVIAGVALAAIAALLGAASAALGRRGARRRPEIGDDIHADGTPYSEAEIEQMIRDYYQAGDL